MAELTYLRTTLIEGQIRMEIEVKNTYKFAIDPENAFLDSSPPLWSKTRTQVPRILAGGTAVSSFFIAVPQKIGSPTVPKSIRVTYRSKVHTIQLPADFSDYVLKRPGHENVNQNIAANSNNPSPSPSPSPAPAPSPSPAPAPSTSPAPAPSPSPSRTVPTTLAPAIPSNNPAPSPSPSPSRAVPTLAPTAIPTAPSCSTLIENSATEMMKEIKELKATQLRMEERQIHIEEILGKLLHLFTSSRAADLNGVSIVSATPSPTDLNRVSNISATPSSFAEVQKKTIPVYYNGKSPDEWVTPYLKELENLISLPVHLKLIETLPKNPENVGIFLYHLVSGRTEEFLNKERFGCFLKSFNRPIVILLRQGLEAGTFETLSKLQDFPQVPCMSLYYYDAKPSLMEKSATHIEYLKTFLKS